MSIESRFALRLTLTLLLVGCGFLLLVYLRPVDFVNTPIVFAGRADNDLFVALQRDGHAITRFRSPSSALNRARPGAAVFIVADGYPAARTIIPARALKKAKDKKLRVYIEYPAALPGVMLSRTAMRARHERAVVTSRSFGKTLEPMSILGLNDAYVVRAKAGEPLLVVAAVAGLDEAAYGIDDVPTYPLLFHAGDWLVATTKLSNFASARHGRSDAWKQVWTYVLSWATGADTVQLRHWPATVTPTFGAHDPLPPDARATSIRRGVEWFENARLYIHPKWERTWRRYQRNGGAPFGPRLRQGLPAGDGTLGVLEGHASKINHDGSQEYRYNLRGDVQAEAGFALAAAGDLLRQTEYQDRAANLLNFLFLDSRLPAKAYFGRQHPSYGLIGWSTAYPGVYYGDDNARAALATLGAAAYLQTDRWDTDVLETILANFRTTGRHGFRGNRLQAAHLDRFGWRHFAAQETINPSPHFESWLWACYLWLYDKTRYAPLLARTREGIRRTMEAYPDRWLWTNGIQQERARMILPLAWLVRVQDTEQHREWLDRVANDLLRSQTGSGAIQEELGVGRGMYGPPSSNRDHGAHEAPVIFANGDPVADMLYTNNFAFFSLNEAAHATGSERYADAADRLGAFLVRVQVKSTEVADLDGAWFRAFHFGRWEYWASSADVNWGPWSTLAGWTQSWIIATQVLTMQSQSYWDLTRSSRISERMPQAADLLVDHGDSVVLQPF